jgi:hypothetical protein
MQNTYKLITVKISLCSTVYKLEYGMNKLILIIYSEI